MFAVITLTADASTPCVAIRSFWETKEAAEIQVEKIRYACKPIPTKKLEGAPTAVTYITFPEGSWEVPERTMQWLKEELKNVELQRMRVGYAQEAIYNHLRSEEEQGTTLHESARAYGLRLGIITE